MLRIAVASKDSVSVSEHFGHARKFYVFDVTQDSCQLLEQREVHHYCLGGSSDKSAMADILETISDCKVVFVTKIGDGPVDKLKVRGIEAVADYCWEEIEPSLLDYVSSKG